MPFDLSLVAALAAAFLAGFVGGFAGFGGAMIFMPVASAFMDPRTAAAAFLVFSATLMAPLVVNAVRVCRWPSVLPAVVAAMLTAPLGAAALAFGDSGAIRWGLSAVVLGLLVLLASGRGYTSEPPPLLSASVGATAGFLGGIAQIAGPPVIVFWMSGPYPPAVIRANLITFFTILSLSSFAAYAWNGFFTVDVFKTIVMLAPTYGIALFLGARMFGRAPESYYRRIAYAVIALAAVTSVPALDGMLR